MKLPTGPGAPATDTAAALAEATGACRAVSAISADVAASGKVNGQRLRGHILIGLAAPDSARLEAVAPAGQPLFIFVSRANDATLLLPRDGRVVEHGQPEAVLEAITGVPVDAGELRHVLTGCVAETNLPPGKALGAEWRLIAAGTSDIYLHRDGKTGRWQVAAAIHRGGDWRAEYRDFDAGLPRSVHLVSADSTRFDLTLMLSQVAVNETLGPEVFRVQVPSSAERISVEDLRHARPGVREN